jgi:hypothetical protein
VRHLVESKGSDGFRTLKEKHAAGKTISALPVPVVTGLFKGLVPAAALSVGALLPVPVPLKVLGAYAGALLGTEGRRRLVPKRDEACIYDLAALLDGQDFTTVRRKARMVSPISRLRSQTFSSDCSSFLWSSLLLVGSRLVTCVCV